jgi:hypothetical protein
MVSSRAEAKVIIEIWRRHFNEERPRSSLGYLTRTSSWLKMQDQRPVRQQVGTLRVGPEASGTLPKTSTGLASSFKCVSTVTPQQCP